MSIPDAGLANGGPPAPAVPAAGQYEFTVEQNKTLAGVAWGFKILGYVFALACFKMVVRLVQGIIYQANGTGRPTTTSDLIEYACLLALFLPLAVWMFRASSGFEDVVNTEGRDIDHLMQGLGALRRSFRWVIGVAITAIVVGLLLPVVMWAGGW